MTELPGMPPCNPPINKSEDCSIPTSTPTINIACKISFPILIGEFELPMLTARPYNKPFLTPVFQFGLTVPQAHELDFNNKMRRQWKLWGKEMTWSDLMFNQSGCCVPNLAGPCGVLASMHAGHMLGCVQVCDHMAPRIFCAWDFPGKNTRVGSHLLLQGIFPTQGSNQSFPHGRQILYYWPTRAALGAWTQFLIMDGWRCRDKGGRIKDQ